MKDKTKGLVAGVLIGALGVSGMVGAKSLTETIQVTYSNIKIFMDGEQLDPRDANGTQVEPFIYNGTTYLPVRAETAHGGRGQDLAGAGRGGGRRQGCKLGRHQ